VSNVCHEVGAASESWPVQSHAQWACLTVLSLSSPAHSPDQRSIVSIFCCIAPGLALHAWLLPAHCCIAPVSAHCSIAPRLALHAWLPPGSPCDWQHTPSCLVLTQGSKHTNTAACIHTRRVTCSRQHKRAWPLPPTLQFTLPPARMSSTWDPWVHGTKPACTGAGCRPLVSRLADDRACTSCVLADQHASWHMHTVFDPTH